MPLGVARDKEGELKQKVEDAIAKGADVIVTSGGVSMGDRDLVKPLLEEIGTVHFGRVRFGRKRGKGRGGVGYDGMFDLSCVL